MKLEILGAEIRRWGWTRGLFKGLMLCLRRYAGLHVYRVSLQPFAQRPVAPELPGGITLRLVPPRKLLEAAVEPELELDPHFVRAAAARGDVAFGAFDGDRLVGYVWGTFTTAPDEEGLWVRVDRPCHYAYKAFTLPPYRGKRIHVALSLLCNQHFRERGYTAVVAFNEISNFSIIAVAGLMGRRRIGFAGYVKWFGRAIPFRTPGLKKIGFEFFDPSRSGGELSWYQHD